MLCTNKPAGRLIAMALTLVLLVLLFSGCAQEFSSPDAGGKARAFLLEENALILTEHLVERALNFVAAGGYGTMEEQALYSFVVTTCLYSYRGATGHPYFDTFSILEDPHLHAVAPARDVQKMVYEVFGISDWASPYEPEPVKMYDFALEVGFPKTSYSCKDAATQMVASNTIAVQFMLVYEYRDPYTITECGEYEITYQIVNEEDTAFLRFLGCVAV